jgi:hypothetical protein
MAVIKYRMTQATIACFVFALLFAILGPKQVEASTFNFTGACSDCTGNGLGVLTVQNYTQGSDFSNGNFVSFTYSSNLIPDLLITLADLDTFTGSIPAVLSVTPGDGFSATAGVTITAKSATLTFQSTTDGSWCVGSSCVTSEDFGLTSSWSSVTTTHQAPDVPEPSTLGLMGVGGAGLGLVRRLGLWHNARFGPTRL